MVRRVTAFITSKLLSLMDCHLNISYHTYQSSCPVACIITQSLEIAWFLYSEKGGSGRMGEKVQGIRSINGRYKIGRGRLRIVWEIEKPKNL